MADNTPDLVAAIQDFRAARSQAALKEILARFTGESIRLLSFDEVRQQLRVQGSAERGLHDIPIDAIVGSVGRYADFTRDFLPLQDSDQERWARVKMANSEMTGLPPIEVYQIGSAYFVKDGNHRVSIARQYDAKYIQAYVTEIRTRVPLTPDVSPDDLIIKAEYAEFLEQNRLDELRPEADLTVTVPGKYELLHEHISVHRYFMGIDEGRSVTEDEATAHWFDAVYLPVVKLIRERGILHYFPGRTETDLYLWIAEHRAALGSELGWDIPPGAVVGDLVERFSRKPGKVIARLGGRLRNRLTLEPLVPGPPPGEWRRTRQEQGDRLFNSILTAISGTEKGWNGLEQALVIARREGAQLHGLHVVPNEAALHSPEAQAVRDQFNQRCQAEGIAGELVLATGEVAEVVCARSRWTDLVVANLAYPPGSQAFSRLSSGFRSMVRRCSPPILAVPQVSGLEHGMLAFDGSPKAQEALYIAAYLGGKWGIRLTVITVETSSQSAQTLEQAQAYLQDHHVQADFRLEAGPVSATLMQVAADCSCDFFLMGGYGDNPVVEIVLGSVVDHVLRESHKPVLICR